MHRTELRSATVGRLIERFVAGPETRIAVSLLAATLAAAGCSTHDRTRTQVERAVGDWRRPQAPMTAARPDATATPAQVRPSTPSPIDSASPPDDLDGYICEALERNPDIATAIADARAKLARIPQVTSLPDPVVRAAGRPEPIQTAAGDMLLTLGISQRFPLLAKLERAGSAAAAETRVALERLNRVRIDLVADVERAYWLIYRLDRYLEITRENLRLLEDVADVVDTQYQVGKVPQQDLLRVHTERAKLRDDVHRFASQRSAAVAAMNRLTDAPPGRAIPVTPAARAHAYRTNVDELMALAAEHSPELAMLREQIAGRREQAALADLGYWPDVALGVEWNYVEGREPFIPPINPDTGKRSPINRKSEVGDDNWAITLQMNLPIWSGRVEASKREARQRLRGAQGALRAAENAIAFRIFDASSRVEARQHTLGVLEGELIPHAQQAYEITLADYQAGDTEFLSVIDSWRRWLDFELMLHRETVDLEMAFADLQREVGMQLLRTETAASDDGDTNHDQ